MKECALKRSKQIKKLYFGITIFGTLMKYTRLNFWRKWKFQSMKGDGNKHFTEESIILTCTDITNK